MRLTANTLWTIIVSTCAITVLLVIGYTIGILETNQVRTVGPCLVKDTTVFFDETGKRVALAFTSCGTVQTDKRTTLDKDYSYLLTLEGPQSETLGIYPRVIANRVV